jgi:threonine/homoserine/homoserine lactone efflux protein
VPALTPARELAVFAVTFAASAAAPGPEVAAFLGRTVSRGLRGGVPLALGIVCGKLLLLAGAVAGLAALVPLLGPAFDVLAYGGAAYLVWLGVRKWRRAGRGTAAVAAWP